MARPSHVRDAVQELLASSHRHDWTSASVLEGLRERKINGDRSSVFRALTRLEAEGLVERVDLGDGITRYEAAGTHHEHVRCERCGAVAAVPGCAVAPVRAAVEDRTGFRLTGHQVVFVGVCPACARDEQA